jgi:hypothetical protein
MTAKKQALVVFLLFFVLPISLAFLPNVQSYTWETVGTYTGTTDKITSVFSISEDARFTWSTTYDDEYWALFTFFIYPQGETVFYEDWFDGLSGSTYFYATGNFYLDVITANLNSWQVTVEQKDYGTTGGGELGTTEIIIGAVAAVAVASGIAAYIIVRRRRTVQPPRTQPPIHQQPLQPQQPIAPAVKFCTQCGTRNEGTTNFCVSCGTKIN